MSFVNVKKLSNLIFIMRRNICEKNMGYLGSLQILLQGDELTVRRCSNLLAPRKEN
jgi:hypothetical protein